MLIFYIYKEESLFFCLLFMHLDTVRANATKLYREYPFVQRKVIEYFSIQNFDPAFNWEPYC